MSTPRRHPNLQRFLDGLQEALDLDDETAQTLLEGSDHPYNCTCRVCLKWWASMGPEYADGKTPSWGPFTPRQIREFKAHQARSNAGGDHDGQHQGD